MYYLSILSIYLSTYLYTNGCTDAVGRLIHRNWCVDVPMYAYTNICVADIRVCARMDACCVYLHMHARTHKTQCTCVYSHAKVCVHVELFGRLHVCMHACVHACMCMHTLVFVHAVRSVHTLTHVHRWSFSTGRRCGRARTLSTCTSSAG